MALNIFKTALLKGTTLSGSDHVRLGLYPGLAVPAGNGDPSAIAAGTPGAGYATIPTVAFANAGTGSGATATALMGVVANPTIAAAGSGGTPGTQTVTGTTGTGTKFQASVTVSGGGAITAVLSVTVAGSYSAMPSSLAAEPVTGASLSGATLNLSAAMGVIGYSAIGGSSNHQYAQGTTATLTGGTPTTAAVPGAVTVTSVAGQGASVSVPVPVNMPAKYVPFGSSTYAGGSISFTKGTNPSTLTATVTPRTADTLTASTLDVGILA